MSGDNSYFSPKSNASDSFSSHYAPIIWTGPHATRRDAAGRRHAPPLGKLHRGGIAIFESLGWRSVPCDTEAVPLFSFTPRLGGDFPADHSAEWPRIRQAIAPSQSNLFRLIRSSGFGGGDGGDRTAAAGMVGAA